MSQGKKSVRLKRQRRYKDSIANKCGTRSIGTILNLHTPPVALRNQELPLRACGQEAEVRAIARAFELTPARELGLELGLEPGLEPGL